MKKWALVFYLLVFNGIVFSQEGLRELAEKKGMFIGAAVSESQLDDADLVKHIKNNFNYLTPGNELKWENVHPTRKHYAFGKTDKIVEFALKNNIRVRGHTLIWHLQNPYWIAKPGTTPEELKEVIRSHISNVVGHYKGKIKDWDVVNEAMDENGFLRENIWQLIIGEEYIEFAFKCANEADPDAKLFINDYSIEEINPKSDGLYNLVKKLKEKKVPIHGVGFQFHLDGRWEPDYESIRANFKRFKDLGLEVQVTEMDVRIPKNYTHSDLERQAKIYGEILKILLSVNGNTFVMWGIGDRFSWIPSFFPGFEAALIFDENLKPKPAYFKLKEVLSK